jgi:hypothetical protein
MGARRLLHITNVAPAAAATEPGHDGPCCQHMQQQQQRDRPGCIIVEETRAVRGASGSNAS